MASAGLDVQIVGATNYLRRGIRMGLWSRFGGFRSFGRNFVPQGFGSPLGRLPYLLVI